MELSANDGQERELHRADARRSKKESRLGGEGNLRREKWGNQKKLLSVGTSRGMKRPLKNLGCMGKKNREKNRKRRKDFPNGEKGSPEKDHRQDRQPRVVLRASTVNDNDWGEGTDAEGSGGSRHWEKKAAIWHE